MTQDKREAAYEKALEIASDGELAPFRAIAVAVDLGYDAATADLQRQVDAMRDYQEWHPCIDDKCPHCHPDKAEWLDDPCDQCGHTRVSHGMDGLGRVMCVGSSDCKCVRFLALTTPTNAETTGEP